MFRHTQYVVTMNRNPSAKPMPGASTMKISVFVQPDGISATIPTLATAAPA